MESVSSNKIYVNLLHYPVYSLGIARRIGIWFQGCSIRCKGCIASHTWEIKQTCIKTVSETLEEIQKYKHLDPDGITISGGEPFDQSDALYTLLENLRSSGFKDIMTYSGYNLEYLKKKYSHILGLIDVLIDGKFVKGQETDYVWKGSENQNMIIITKEKKLQKLYDEYMQKKSNNRELQIVEKKNNIYVVGIPKQKDTEAMKNGFS